MNDIAERLSKKGLKNIHTYEFGVIIGEMDDELVKKINDKDIISVNEESDIHISPPDSKIQ